MLLPVLASAATPATAASCAARTVSTAVPNQNFEPWSGLTSPDGAWRINGTWTGTDGNTIDPTLAQLTSTYDGISGGFLSLTVAANQKRGSEIQTLANPGYGYGHYEACIKVSPVSGVVDSFFWIEAPNYGPHEWDIEFLTPDFSANAGAVHFTIHPTNATYKFPLPFNPGAAFHRYGFTWTPGTIVFYVDGKVAYTFMDPSLNTSATGFIMANTWTGNPSWGGGPPTQNATSVYAWARYTASSKAATKSH